MTKLRKIQFVKSYGVPAIEVKEEFPQTVTDHFSLNSPVGVVMDHHHNVWVCDVGNNRIVILSPDLDQLLGVIKCPLESIAADDESDIHQLIMPFHVCPHPEKKWMYVTEIGNQRILVFEYGMDQLEGSGHYAHCVRAFDDEIVVDEISAANLDRLWEVGRDKVLGGTKKNCYNGITVIRDASSPTGWCVYAADEFYQPVIHADQAPGSASSLHIRLDRSRVVRFTDHGDYLSHFRGVQVADGSRIHNLLWPQGLCTDSQGNLYVANTGKDEIIKCDPTSPMDGDENLILQDDIARTQFHALHHDKGNHYTTSMRSVSVIDDKVFISASNTITVYDRKNNTRGLILGEFSTLQAMQLGGSLTDIAFQSVGSLVLSCPYEICKSAEPDVYYLTEPFLSKVVKIKIEMRHDPGLRGQAAQVFRAQGLTMDSYDFVTSAKIIKSLDSRRDRRDDKFNVASCVFAIEPRHKHREDIFRPKQPFDFAVHQMNHWLSGWTALMDMHYKWINTAQMKQPYVRKLKKFDLNERQLFCVDMGNWKLKSFHDEHFTRYKRFPFAGTICVAVYYPRKPLLGQLCADKPLLLTVNTCFGIVTIMQFDEMNRLEQYGLPFGLYQMKGPQGIAVTDDGEVYIADPVANRVWKWRILQNGMVVMVDSFTAPELPPDANQAADELRKVVEFLPTSVAISQKNHLFVCDQGNSTIRVFDNSGHALCHFGYEGYWDGSEKEADHFCLPTSLCIHEDLLFVNDLVNRAIKIFRINEDGAKIRLQYLHGKQFFNLRPEHGGLWMPFFIHADEKYIYVPDSTFNVINVYAY